MRTFKVRAPVALALTMSIVVAMGMAQAQVPDGQAPGPQQNTAEPQHHCNTGVAAALGGLLGAFAGRGKGHLVGAAVGAGIGALACTAFNYHVRKLQDAQQVDAQYEQQHGALPQSSTVTAYTTSLQPSGPIPAGTSNVSVQSTITVVNGTDNVSPNVTETLTLIDPNGKDITSATKQAAGSGGEYQTSFDFPLQKGVKDGRYTLRTVVSMNGQPQQTNTTPMEVVAG